MNKQILFLEEIDKSMGALVGGKGANLGELTHQGFPVPSGFCITTEGYKKFVKDLNTENKRPEEIRDYLKAHNLDEDTIHDLNRALDQFDDDTLFSVRSSATAEDLPYASFAGQQDTYLNVKKEDIKDAIINCYISLYSDRAVSYREENDIREPSMAVVVQQMVDSESSGVMFTANPVTGNRNQIVINSIFGLGEAIVSGLVSPDYIVINKNTGSYTQENSQKEFALLTNSDGTTIKKELNESKASLTEEHIFELKRLGELIEKHYESPQDIEWALFDNKIYILQSRAITTLYPVPVFSDGKFHFMFNMGYQQMNPVAMPVLSLDVMKAVTNFHNYDISNYRSSFIQPVGQHLFLDFSSILSIIPKFVRSIIIDNLVLIIDPLMASSLEELFERNLTLANPDPIIFKKFASVIRKFPKYLTSNEPEKLTQVALGRIREKVDQIKELLETANYTPQTIQKLFNELYLVDTFLLNFMPLVFSGILSLKKLEAIERKMKKEGEWTSKIQLGNEGNIVTEMNLELGDLADFLLEEDSLRELFQKEDFDIRSYLEQNENSFMKAFSQFLNDYGFRGPGELDISQPRWSEEPEIVLKQILNLAKNKKLHSHRIDYLENVIAAKEASRDLIEAVRDTYGYRKAKEVSSELKRYRHYYALREHLKYYWMEIFGYVKKYILNLGQYLKEKDQLENSNDIFHLKFDEIINALESNESQRELIEERKSEFQRIKKLTPPRIITSEGEVLMGGLKRDDIPDDAFVGLGVSPGSVEGIAKIVLDPNNAQVKEGEILVAPFTDPGWTPLFINAAALVTEVGGTLTHGAVVAREYGIPGVVGVIDATKSIKTGDRILVDGSTGYVKVLENESGNN